MAKIINYDKLCPHCGSLVMKGFCAKHHRVGESEILFLATRLKQNGVLVSAENIEEYREKFIGLREDGFSVNDAIDEISTDFIRSA